MDEYTLQADATWAAKCYQGDVDQVVHAGFDGLKIDNCGDDRGVGFAARERAINASGHAMMIENSNQGDGNPAFGPNGHGKPGPPRNNPDNSSEATGYSPFNM